MTQVSRFPLSRALEEQMHTIFRRALVDLTTEEAVGDFLDDLLTPTEKVMLGKRLAIAFLLDKGFDQRTIHRIMNVSVSTVNHVNFWLKNRGKGYRRVIDATRKKKQWSDAVGKLDEIIKDVFLPPKTIGQVITMRDNEQREQDSIV